MLTESNNTQPASRLGDYLLENGLVSKAAIEAALREQEVTGEPLGILLVRGGFISYETMISAVLATNPGQISQEHVITRRVPVEDLERVRAIIVADTASTIYVASPSPKSLVESVIAKHYPGKSIEIFPLDVARYMDYLDAMSVAQRSSDDLGVESLLQEAAELRVSDIHLVPRLKTYSIFFRRLGVRQLVYERPLDEYPTLVARIKDMARMDFAERRIDQDGGFSYEFNGNLIDVRVVSVPSASGETIVMRLLDPDRVHPNLDKLGITRVDEWRRGFSRANGLCLVCGPTGSGKTTTLNATVRELDRFSKAIYTAEDPVEYKIAYTSQVGINPSVGLDFPRALRAFMRADPDIIILGEIRDQATAQNAIRAAETGHLVLATLHTESILGSMSRLRDLGVDDYNMRFLLRCVLVQQLIRKVCPRCEGEGCPACGQTGYSAARVVSECKYFPSADDVSAALDGKMDWPTMLDDAFDAYLRGETDMRELRRVFGYEADRKLKEYEEKMEGRRG